MQPFRSERPKEEGGQVMDFLSEAAKWERGARGGDPLS